MSVIWNAEKLFAHTANSLETCDGVIEKLVDYDGEPTPRCPLDEHELQSAHKLLRLCGVILSRVFGDMKDREDALAGFVFRDDTHAAEVLIKNGNREYVRKSNEQDDELDKEHDVSDRVKRGIEWLDGRSELGTWEAAILPGVLDLKDPCNCVAGSIFDEYDDTREGSNGFKRVCEMLSKENLSPVELGFQTNGEAGDCARLQKEWLEQVEKRR